MTSVGTKLSLASRYGKGRGVGKATLFSDLFSFVNINSPFVSACVRINHVRDVEQFNFRHSNNKLEDSSSRICTINSNRKLKRI